MVPQVRLRESTFARLQKWAEPLRDNVDDTINRVLDLAEGRESSEARVQLQAGASKKGGRSRRKDSTEILTTAGVIAHGSQLRLLRSHLPEGADPDDPAFSGTLAADGWQIVWARDGQEYSMSALTEKLRSEDLAPISKGPHNGAMFWRPADLEESLHELAERMYHDGASTESLRALAESDGATGDED